MNEETLVRYVSGELSANEREQVDRWLQTSEEHRQKVVSMKWIWEQTGELPERGYMDPEHAWQRFKIRLEREKARAIPAKIHRPVWQRVAAAAAVLLIGFAGWQFLAPKELPWEFAEARTGTALVSLADGTTVTLNRGGALRFPAAFQGNERRVELQGEGFFEVKADPDHPFLVTAGNAEILVTGTSFNINVYPDSTVVIVETGSVQLRAGQEALRLEADEKGVAFAVDPVLFKTPRTDRLHEYYRSREFVCDDTPLPRLLHVLEEVFQVKFDLQNPELEKLRITTTFSGESLDAILRVIGETFEIDVVRNHDTVILK